MLYSCLIKKLLQPFDHFACPLLHLFQLSLMWWVHLSRHHHKGLKRKEAEKQTCKEHHCCFDPWHWTHFKLGHPSHHHPTLEASWNSPPKLMNAGV